jgi:Phosphate transporter family
MAAAQMSLWALFTLIAIAFMFDMMNGLHDAANSIATVVSTNVMSPRIAVLWAAFFNFIAFLVFGLNVAQTLGTGIVPEQLMDPQILVGALFGAIAWDAITWWGGIPSSSSHALVGGLVGAGLRKGRPRRRSVERCAQDRPRDHLFAACWVCAGPNYDSRGVLGIGAPESFPGRSRFSDSTARYSGTLLIGPWRQ